MLDPADSSIDFWIMESLQQLFPAAKKDHLHGEALILQDKETSKTRAFSYQSHLEVFF